MIQQPFLIRHCLDFGLIESFYVFSVFRIFFALRIFIQRDKFHKNNFRSNGRGPENHKFRMYPPLIINKLYLAGDFHPIGIFRTF